MKVALLGLTGFGNAALRGLLDAGISPLLVVSRDETGPYPYYEETGLFTECNALGVRCELPGPGELALLSNDWDLIVVATYHRKISDAILARTRCSVNLHPSLLPKYRGASPCFWALYEGAKISGISVHRISSEFDRGEIFLQKSYAVASAETQGSLRRALSKLTQEVVVSLIATLRELGTLSGLAQDELDASSHPRFNDSMRHLDSSRSVAEIERHIRALAPWPLAIFDSTSIESADLENSISADEDARPAGTILAKEARRTLVQLKDGQLWLIKAD